MTQFAKGLHHKAEHDPRAAALLALNRVLAENADSQAALDGVLGSMRLMPTDKRLCTEIVYGSLRWHLKLRAFSEHFLAKPEKLPSEMRLALMTALYEMVFLRTPHHAAVNWTVGHICNRFGKGLAGVANGALRSMQRKLGEFNGPASPASPAQPLHARFAMPKWIAALWTDSYGEEAAAQLLAASQEAPPAGLRINRSRPEWQALLAELFNEYSGEVGEVEPALLYFTGPLPWQARTLIKDGRATRQSGASYQAVQALAPSSWQGPVWDCCCGRGGKSLTLLEQGLPVALASDPSRQRLAGLSKEYERLLPEETASGRPLIIEYDASLGPEALAEAQETARAQACDKAAEPSRGPSDPSGPDGPAVSLAPSVPGGPAVSPEPSLPGGQGTFGTVLVDAPCSGLGTLARRPEIRLRRTPEDIERLAALQSRILNAVWPSVAAGGQLVYITCTVSPAENEEQIAAFLQQHADAEHSAEFRTPYDSPLREFFYGAVLKKRG